MFEAVARNRPRIEFLNYLSATSVDQMADEIRKGLAADQKTIPSKYFYDGRGSRLFEEICQLPEYYLTRTELALLRSTAKNLIHNFEHGDIVELGSGSSAKIRVLLDAMSPGRRSAIRYVPVDVSSESLMDSSAELLNAYPELQISCVLADFTLDVHRLPLVHPKLILFFGSTIGNFQDREIRAFLSTLASALNPGDKLLLGLDLIKPIDVLEVAYNDSRQLTADFNKNVLNVLNREMGADFYPEYFEHLAFFNEEHSRIEMHLRAKFSMVVRFSGMDLTVRLEKGETIQTEISRKFTRSEVEAFVEDAGMVVMRWNTDPKNWFSIAEIVLAEANTHSLSRI